MSNRTNCTRKLFGAAGNGERRELSAVALLLALAFLVVSVTQGISATPRLAALQAMDPAQVAAAIKANAQALRAFVWQQRIQIQLKGETKKVTLNQMNYDVNGNLQKTLLSEQPAPDSSQPESGRGLRGRVKQKVVTKKTGEFKEMMEGIAALVKSYTEMPPDQLQAALKRATFSLGQGDMGGSIQVQMTGVLQPADALTVWIDREAMLFRRVVISTTYEQQSLTATANYARLQTGQVYMGQAMVNYPAKQVVLQIDNLNYQESP